MTIGHLLETISAKICAVKGCKFSDGTSFSKRVSVENLQEALKNLGFHPGGNEVFYHGATGKKMTSQLFIGPCFYQVSVALIRISK
jgi:DNA-directed RNA polymerase II subunit RPB2